MAILKTEAFVLRTQPFRSSSLIVTFFTRDYGKIRGIVKGVRREAELRGALYELFTHLEIVYYEKLRSELHLISQAFILESHDELRTKLNSISYASYFAELVDRLSEVHDPHPEIFELIEQAFRFIPSISGEKLARLFEVKLLREIGWLPYLDSCLNCQNTAFETGFFSVHQGALYCPACAPEVPDARPLSVSALAALRYDIGHPFDTALKYRIPPPTEQEMKRFMDRFLLYRLGSPLKSRRFMEQIEVPRTTHASA